MSTPESSPGGRQRRFGIYLMLVFTVGWIVTMLSIQFYQGVQRGFGTGFGDGGHVPIAVAQQVGSSDPKVVVAATSLNAPKISAAEDVGRLVFSFAVLIGIIYFWYLVMSKVGTF